ATNWRRGIVGELNRNYEPDSAVVPNGLFGRDAQFARDILRIERAVELDSRKAPHLDHGWAITSHSSQGQTADRVLIHVDTELSAKCPLNSRMAYVACRVHATTGSSSQRPRNAQHSPRKRCSH